MRAGYTAYYHGDDYIDAKGGNDTVWGEGGADTILGGAGDDDLQGDAEGIEAQYQGNDQLFGGEGNDTLVGDGGNDTLDGGSGADYLMGGAGDDVYLNVSGEDTINDTEGYNIVHLTTAIGLGTGGVVVSPFGDQNQYLRLEIALNNGETLKFEDAFYGSDATLQFAGGDTLDLQTLVGTQLSIALTLQLNDAGGRVYGGAGADSLFGGNGADTLSGALGEDKLYGRAGDDLLIGGDGDDILDGGEGGDTLIGGTGRDLVLGGGGDDIYHLNLAADGGVIADSQGQNLIRFGNGINPNNLIVSSSILAGQIALTLKLANVELATITQGPNSFSYEFTDGKRLTADELLLDYRVEVDDDYGSSEEDILLGSRGADRLSGYSGNDTLWGGGDDDILEGGLGSDDYRYRLGDGHDLIQEVDDSETGQDTQDRVSFGEGIEFGDVLFSRRANGDLSVSVAGLSDAITIAGWYGDSANRVESFVFADGQTVTVDTLLALAINPQTGGEGNDVLTGTDYHDILVAGAGNDLLIGNGDDDDLHGETGSDTYRLALEGGADRVLEMAGEASIIEVDGFDLSRLTGTRIDDDLVLSVTAAADSLMLSNFYGMPHDWLVVASKGSVSQSLDAVLADNTAARAGRGELQRLEDNFLAKISDEVAQWYSEQGMVQQTDGSWLGNLQLSINQRVDTYSRASGYTGFVPSNTTEYGLNKNYEFALGYLNIATYSAEDAANYADDSSSYQTKNLQVNWSPANQFRIAT